MKSLPELRADIVEANRVHKETIQALNDEIEAIQGNCPHPKYFLDSEVSNSYDDGDYVDSALKVTCRLCELSVWSNSYHHSLYSPSREDVIGSLVKSV